MRTTLSAAGAATCVGAGASDPARCGSVRSSSGVAEGEGRASALACPRCPPVRCRQSVVKREATSVRWVATRRWCTQEPPRVARDPRRGGSDLSSSDVKRLERGVSAPACSRFRPAVRLRSVKEREATAVQRLALCPSRNPHPPQRPWDPARCGSDRPNSAAEGKERGASILGLLPPRKDPRKGGQR